MAVRPLYARSRLLVIWWHWYSTTYRRRAISTRDLTGTADSDSYQYAWKSDEIALIGAIMSAAVADSDEPGTVMRGSPPSPAAIDTSRDPLSRAVALLTGKLMAFLA